MYFNYRESMEGHLAQAVESAKVGDTNKALESIAMALQEMSGRLDALEEKAGVEYEGDNQRAESD